MDENNNIKKAPNVPPFLRYCSAIIPTAFDDSLSYYEALCALYKFLQDQVINTINNNANVTQYYIGRQNELEALFEQLKEYVDTYFDNLDVQEEINNKLDDMVESGQLSDLIAQYIGLGALVTFDTYSDMVDSINLSKGSKCKTLGKESKGDGFGAYYTVDENGDIELANGLFATLVPNYGGNNYYSYYNDITTTTERHNNTTCYITTIPYLDHNSKEIKPYISQCNESPLRYSQKNKTSFTMNASLGKHTLIHNGEVLVDRDSGNASLPNSAQYLAITADRNLIGFTANTATYSNMIAGGAIEAWLVFYQIINNSVKPDWSTIDSEWSSEGSNIATSRHPRQCLGIKADKTIIVLTTDGRRPSEWGLTSDECADILLDLGCVNAWNLDGGGSTSTSINGYKLNTNIDDDYTSDREAIDACLNIKLPTIDEELGNVNSYIGKAINENNAKLIKLINSSIVASHTGDVDGLINGQSINYVTGGVNTPSGSGYIQSIPISLDNLLGQWGKQIFYERNRGRIFSRSKQNNSYTTWLPSDGYKAFLYDRPTTKQNITADNTYEKYQFLSPNIQNNTSYNNFITVDANNDVSFNGDCTKAIVTIQFDLYTSSTGDPRYIRCSANGSILADTTTQWRDNQGINQHTIQFIMDASKKLSIEFYGKAGDGVSKLKITAESFS